MKQSTLVVLMALLILSSCSPKVITNIQKTYPAQDSIEDVNVIGLDEAEPDYAEYIGNVLIHDTGFSTNCGYDVVIGKAKTEAVKAGGNTLKLTEHIPPSIWASSCHQIAARILLVDESLSDSNVIKTASVDNTIYSQLEPMLHKDEPVEEREYKRFRLAVNGGYSYQLAKISDEVPADFKDYIKGLKSGYHFGADANYFFSEQMGLGAKYTMFGASNSIDNIYLEDEDGDRIYGSMSDDLRIMFIGPYLSTRYLAQKSNNAFFLSLGIGYLSYKNDKVIINPIRMTGGTAGYTLDVGYDIEISEDFSLGFQVSMLSGVLRKYTLDNGYQSETIELEEGQYEGLGRIDFSIGLRFNK